MRVPDPKANTTTEAYLAYKAGYLEESELKPKLYEPYLHFDAWLAYWAGLTNEYPFNASEKNVLQLKKYSAGGIDVKLAAGGMIRVAGTTQNSYANFMAYQTPIDLKAGVYTFSRVGDKTYTVSLTVYNEDKTQYTSINITAGNSSSTANIAFDIKYIAGAFTSLTVGSSLDFVTGLQLEAGSDASEFETSTIPEMLCDEEALVAYLSGVTDTYPEEIKDPYDVRIVGYLKHLASTRWPEPDYPVNNEEFYLSTMEPTHTSNSEPSADIELDTTEGKIISVEAYGDTFQQTYSGKNLFNYQGVVNLAIATLISARSNYRGYYIQANAGDTFTLSRATTTGNNRFRVCFTMVEPAPGVEIYNENGVAERYISADGATEVSFTVPQDMHYVFIYLSNSAQDITESLKIQLEAGSTATAYEPYVGGIPSPNPDYPQDVQVVTGEQTVKVTGKNLLRLVQMSTPSQGITTTMNSDGSITVSGTASSTWATLTSASTDVALSSGGTYTFSIDKELPVSIGLISSGVTRQEFNIAPNRTSVTATANYDNTALSLYIFGLTQNQSYNFTIYPQFEEGSSVTTYEPFQSQTYTVDLGSMELCKIGDYQDYIYKSGDEWYIHKEVGDFDLSTGTYVATTGSIRGLTNAPNIKYTPNNQTIGSAVTSGYRLRQGQGLGVAGVGWFAVDTGRVNFNTGGSTDPVGMLYYALATSTDTQITDTTLVGQLEALAGADTYNEKTFIGVTATDPNLPALLKIEAYKY